MPQLPPAQYALTSPPLEQEVLHLADALGWSFLPVKPDSKAPLSPRGVKNATSDPAALQRFFRTWPNMHVGLAAGKASGTVLIDIDDPAALAVLEQELGPLPKTPSYTTPRGGEHRIFRYPAGHEIPNSVGQLGAGIDVRSDGGYGKCAPSPGYKWVNHPDDVVTAELPAAYVERLAAAQAQAAPNGGSRSNLAALLANRPVEGERNDWFAKVCGHYASTIKHHDAYEATVRQIVEGLALDADEITATIASIWRAEHAKPASADHTPSAALAESRVDLVDLIRRGLPPRQFVPGCEPWLIAGKRYLIFAPAGTGKSIWALVTAVTVIEHGGSVVILDVENGEEEYAARLQDILRARDQDGKLAVSCQERLHYHAWPTLSIKWAPEDWAQALADPDLVIFDSSRFMLSAAGLDEDKSNDYSAFVTRLIVPAIKAGATTMMLDNTGHVGRHARGTSAKGDLNEVCYSLAIGATFDSDKVGNLNAKRERQRFPGLPHTLNMTLGCDTYTPAEVVEYSDEFVPTNLMEKVSRALERCAEKRGLSQSKLIDQIGSREAHVITAINQLEKHGFIEVEDTGKGKPTWHRSLKPYREGESLDPADSGFDDSIF
jgi:hypothetical protein